MMDPILVVWTSVPQKVHFKMKGYGSFPDNDNTGKPGIESYKSSTEMESI
jgi:hypothetical protein